MDCTSERKGKVGRLDIDVIFMFLFPWDCFFLKGNSFFWATEGYEFGQFSSTCVFTADTVICKSKVGFLNTEKQPCCIDLFWLTKN